MATGKAKGGRGAAAAAAEEQSRDINQDLQEEAAPAQEAAPAEAEAPKKGRAAKAPREPKPKEPPRPRSAQAGWKRTNPNRWENKFSNFAIEKNSEGTWNVIDHTGTAVESQPSMRKAGARANELMKPTMDALIQGGAQSQPAQAQTGATAQ